MAIGITRTTGARWSQTSVRFTRTQRCLCCDARLEPLKVIVSEVATMEEQMVEDLDEGEKITSVIDAVAKGFLEATMMKYRYVKIQLEDNSEDDDRNDHEGYPNNRVYNKRCCGTLLSVLVTSRQHILNMRMRRMIALPGMTRVETS